MTWLYLCMANNLDLNIYDFAANSGIWSFCHVLNKNNQWKIIPPIKLQSKWMLNSLTADTADLFKKSIFQHKAEIHKYWTTPPLLWNYIYIMLCNTSAFAPMFAALSPFWMLSQLSRPTADGQWRLWNLLKRGGIFCLWIHLIKNIHHAIIEYLLYHIPWGS